MLQLFMHAMFWLVYLVGLFTKVAEPQFHRPVTRCAPSFSTKFFARRASSTSFINVPLTFYLLLCQPRHSPYFYSPHINSLCLPSFGRPHDIWISSALTTWIQSFLASIWDTTSWILEHSTTGKGIRATSTSGFYPHFTGEALLQQLAPVSARHGPIGDSRSSSSMNPLYDAVAGREDWPRGRPFPGGVASRGAHAIVAYCMYAQCTAMQTANRASKKRQRRGHSYRR